MGIISWIAIGLLAGAVARLIMPGKESGGIIITILLGIGGALLGGAIGARLGIGSFRGFDLESILIATGGAVLILLIFRALKKK